MKTLRIGLTALCIAAFLLPSSAFAGDRQTNTTLERIALWLDAWVHQWSAQAVPTGTLATKGGPTADPDGQPAPTSTSMSQTAPPPSPNPPGH